MSAKNRNLQEATDVAITCFGKPPISVSVMDGGRSSMTFLVRTKDDDMVLQRVRKAINPTSDDVVASVENHHWFRENEIFPCPGQIVPDKGTPGFTHQILREGYWWHAMEHVPSCLPDILEPDCLVAYGAILGRINRSRPVSPPCPWNCPDPRTLVPVVRAMCENNRFDPDRDDFAKFFIDLSSRVALPAGPTGLCHGDPKRDNLLHVDGLPRYVIDFDCLHVGPIARDLGDLIRSCVGTQWRTGAIDIDVLTPMVESHGFFTMDQAIRSTLWVIGQLGLRFLSSGRGDNVFFSKYREIARILENSL